MTRWHSEQVKRLYLLRLLVSLAGGFSLARLLIGLVEGSGRLPLVLWSAAATASVFVYMRFTRKIRHRDEVRNRRTRKRVSDLEARVAALESKEGR